MRMSSRVVVAPSAVGILSIALLCVLSGAAQSQTAGSSGALPGVTIDAPKQRARPHRLVARPQRPRHVANTIASRPASPPPQTPLAQAMAHGSVMSKFVAIETVASRAQSTCADGCPTSFKTASQPWNGCSSPGSFILSTTCRNPPRFRTYEECREIGMFVGFKSTEMWWYCSSLHAGGKLSGEKQQQFAERSGRR